MHDTHGICNSTKNRYSNTYIIYQKLYSSKLQSANIREIQQVSLTLYIIPMHFSLSLQICTSCTSVARGMCKSAIFRSTCIKTFDAYKYNVYAIC